MADPNPQNNPTGNYNVPGPYYQQNPGQAIRDNMRAHGVDPDMQTGFGNFIQKLMGAVVPVMFQNMYSKDGTMAMDQIGHPDALLNSIFAGNGNIGANLKGFADNALAAAKGFGANMSPETVQRMMSDLSALQNFGNNSYQQEAARFGLNRSFNQYQDQFDRMAHGGTPINQTLWDYMQGQASNPSNFMTGGLDPSVNNGAGPGVTPPMVNNGGGVGTAPIRTSQNNPNY